MHKRNIVIAPCGNKSYLFEEAWLKNKEERNFDICLLFYHEHINNQDVVKSVDHFYHLKDFKYKMIFTLLTKINPEWLQHYDYFYFLDDDIYIDTESINQLFNLSKAFDTSISCAALSADSFCSWPIFKQDPTAFLRYVGQIEVMAPLFNSQTLKLMLPTFVENKSSWGIDSVWSKLLNYPKNKMVIFDTVVMKHTLPVGGGELYLKIGVSPHDEWASIVDRYGAKMENFVEYGRLKYLSTENSIPYSIKNSISRGFSQITKKMRDYDLLSRIKNRLGFLSGKKII
ncbi:hypothetical protein HDC92_000024 [Pedobacter sp. AK017]|uniref:hypothetical protein n=1 Tax=Pedobacter sp. AK017 TaxID=2723073 RepID=UPI001622C06D|nr:hypothetical protein [Pedobacter sp. AK017]MBB5436360.1 hypothetical protein [Pedobacter sp. AK017]